MASPLAEHVPSGAILLYRLYNTQVTVYQEPVDVANLFEYSGNIDDSRDAILSGNDCAVRKIAARLHHDAGSAQEQGGPAGISRGRNQDISALEVTPFRRMQNNPAGPSCLPGSEAGSAALAKRVCKDSQSNRGSQPSAKPLEACNPR